MQYGPVSQQVQRQNSRELAILFELPAMHHLSISEQASYDLGARPISMVEHVESELCGKMHYSILIHTRCTV